MSSTSIYGDFTPTYLYIKQHSVTGLMYFGKTTKSDPIKYLGSGVHWQRHIKKHGLEHVVTLWYELFTNRDELIQFATQFSKSMNIVESTSWANLCEETGIDGPVGYSHTLHAKVLISLASKGRVVSSKTREKLSIIHQGTTQSDITKEKIRQANKDKVISDITRQNMSKPKTNSHKISISDSMTGKKHQIVICPYCTKSGGITGMMRWHFDNCKSK